MEKIAPLRDTTRQPSERSKVNDTIAWINGTRDKTVTVKSLDDLPAPKDGVISLEEDTSYMLNGLVTIDQYRLKWAANCFLGGINWQTDLLFYTGAGAAIENPDSRRMSMGFCGIVSPNGYAMDLDMGDEFLTVQTMGFFAKNGVRVANGQVNSLKFCLYKSIPGLVTAERQLEFTGSCDKIFLSESPFYSVGAGNYMLGFNGVTANVIHVQSCFFKSEEASEVCVSSTGTQPTGFGLFNGVTFQGPAQQTDGFDQTTVGWDFTSNQGIDNSKVSGGFYSTAADTFTLATNDQWYVINGTYTGTMLERLTFDQASSELTYVGRRSFLGRMIVNISAECTSNNNTYQFGVYVNGTQVGATVSQEFRQGGIINNVPLNVFLRLEEDDVIDVRVRRTDGADALTVDSISVSFS